MKSNLVHVSKFISLVLRHQPEKIGLTLDSHGWANVKDLLTKSEKFCRFSFTELCEVVDTNEKKRFVFNADKTQIRAAQGHSIDVDLQLKPIAPPDVLYHGTAKKNLDSIMKTGLLKQNRHHVHLSRDWETALNVGKRHGAPVVLTIDCEKMVADGYLFYQSSNHVWLTETVPSKYITERYVDKP